MSCWHHYGPYCEWPPSPEWADYYRRHRWLVPWEPDEAAYTERERRRGSRRERRERDDTMRLDDLEARARELRVELERIDDAIERLAARADEDERS